MDSFIVASGSSQLNSPSTYTGPQSLSQGSTSLHPTQKPSSTWEKFIPPSPLQSTSESIVTIIPITKTTTKGPPILKPAIEPEDYDTKAEEFIHFLDSFETETETIDDMADGQ